MSRGRKPASPKVKDLAAGTHRPEEATAPAGIADDAPPWVTHKDARELWSQLMPELRRRHQYIPLFQVELGRYCVAFGMYRDAIRKITGARKSPVVKSGKGVEMLSQHWVVANNAHKTMYALAGDLGLNPVGQLRMAGLQLDLFDPTPGPDGDNVTSFSKFRRPQ